MDIDDMKEFIKKFLVKVGLIDGEGNLDITCILIIAFSIRLLAHPHEWGSVIALGIVFAVFAYETFEDARAYRLEKKEIDYNGVKDQIEWLKGEIHRMQHLHTAVEKQAQETQKIIVQHNLTNQFVPRRQMRATTE